MSKTMIYRLIVFATVNFGALALGSFFTGNGVSSDWYSALDKAPWTPPGWAFGFAWTTIMICYSIYMASLWSIAKNKNLVLSLFIIQWILNVGWNPAFFYYHNVLAALFIIVGLAFIVGFFLFHYWSELRLSSVLIIPYFVWLLIAISLNAYIQLKN